jgi:hypothetical protein
LAVLGQARRSEHGELELRLPAVRERRPERAHVEREAVLARAAHVRDARRRAGQACRAGLGADRLHERDDVGRLRSRPDGLDGVADDAVAGRACRQVLPVGHDFQRAVVDYVRVERDAGVDLHVRVARAGRLHGSTLEDDVAHAREMVDGPLQLRVVIEQLERAVTNRLPARVVLQHLPAVRAVENDGALHADRPREDPRLELHQLKRGTA